MQVSKDDCLNSFFFSTNDHALQLYFYSSGYDRKARQKMTELQNSKRFLERHDDIVLFDPCYDTGHHENEVYTWCMMNIKSKWGQLKPSTFFWFKDRNDAALFKLMWC
jgi:hypothetical protein